MKKRSKEMTSYQREKQINDAKTKLLELFLKQAGSSSGKKVVLMTMQKVLDIISDLSSAETGSIFLLDKNGAVEHYILTQDDLGREKEKDLLGRVLDEGLAGWVKKNLDTGIIQDTATDDRWITLTSQPYTVRSAIAAPILRHNYLFGIITLAHSRPSHFDHDVVNVIQHAAGQLAIILENAMLYKKLDDALKSADNYSKQLNFELEQGKKIQRNFLPGHIAEVRGYDIATWFSPALHLSGDFYDIFQLPDNRIGIALGDVSGKGVGAALFMALTRSLIRVFSGADRPAGKDSLFAQKKTLSQDISNTIEMTNEYLVSEHGHGGMFVTLFLGVLDTADGMFSYISAGHEPVLVVDRSGFKTMLEGTGPVLGVIPGMTYESRHFQLGEGDILIGYTDGVTEARSEQRNFYTRSRLMKLLEKGFKDSAEKCLRMVTDDLFTFTANAPQYDDITLVALKRRSKTGTA